MTRSTNISVVEATAQPRHRAGIHFHTPAKPAAPAFFREASASLRIGSAGWPGVRGAFPKACGKLRSRRGACFNHSGERTGGPGRLPSRRGKRLNRRGGVLNRCGKLRSHPDHLLKGRGNGKALKNRPNRGKISRKGATAQKFRDFNPWFFPKTGRLGVRKNNEKFKTNITAQNYHESTLPAQR